MFQTGSFNYRWLLSETHTVLKKQLKAEKQELMLVAGAIAGLASALSACKVCVSPTIMLSTNGCKGFPLARKQPLLASRHAFPQ